MKCNRCGAELALEEQFCGLCGAPRPQLDPRFGQVERLFAVLRRRFQAGELSNNEFEARLRELIITDESGNCWMLGVESGRWYRLQDGQWVAQDAPLVAPATVSNRRSPRWLWLSLLLFIPLLGLVGLTLLAVRVPYPRLAYYSLVIAVYPETPWPYLERARLFRDDLDDLAAATADLDTLIALEPTWSHYEMRAELQLERGAYTQAAADYGAAIGLDPQQAHLYLSRGQAYEQLGAFDLALEDYDTAVAQAPEQCYPLYLRGTLYQRQGQTELARQDLQRVLTFTNQDCFFLRETREALVSLGPAPVTPTPAATAVVPAVTPLTPDKDATTGWVTIALEGTGIEIEVPAGWSLERMVEMDMLLLHDQQRLCPLDLSWSPVRSEATAAGELRQWLDEHPGTNWSALTHGDTPLGPLAWSRGHALDAGPIFAVVIGPTRDNFALYWWGQPTAEAWDACLVVFNQMIAGSTYAGQ